MLAHGWTHALCLFLREDWKTTLFPSPRLPQLARPRGGPGPCCLSLEWLEVSSPGGGGRGTGLWEQASPSLCLVWPGLIWVWRRHISLVMGAPAPSVSARAAALGSLVRQAWADDTKSSCSHLLNTCYVPGIVLRTSPLSVNLIFLVT